MKKVIKERRIRTPRIGPVGEKILLLLEVGVILGLTARPDTYFRIVRQAQKEWQKINTRSLHNAIKRLYDAQLIDYKEYPDGSTALILSENGKERTLRYCLDTITIQKTSSWDGYWRIVMFDIPEQFKQKRDALSQKLKQLGFQPMQKSVFIFPYECKNEIDFIVEIFRLRPYVRYLIAKEIDIALDFKIRFRL